MNKNKKKIKKKWTKNVETQNMTQSSKNSRLRLAFTVIANICIKVYLYVYATINISKLFNTTRLIEEHCF